MQVLREHRYGIFGTIIFHIIVIVLFILFGFKVPYPPPPEEGIVINFGYTEKGSGDIEPEAEENKLVAPEEVSPQKFVEDKEILTQDFEEAPSENMSNIEEEVEVSREQEEESRLNPDVLYKGTGESDYWSNEGEGVDYGNQGRDDGSIHSPYHDEGGGGSGITYSLSGRTAVSGLPKPEYTSNEEGYVVVEIIVDREGKVINAIPGVKRGNKKTTIYDKDLWEAAKKAALRTKFNKKSDAPINQKGTITYHFVLK